MIPKISIIVPVYKVEAYIDRCIYSLLDQTLKDIEIILIDDESPDDSPKICDNYSSEYPFIKVIHKKNGGLGFARNSGLDIAKGEYVMFLDSDDEFEKTACERFYNIAKKYNADVVSGNFIIEKEPGTWIEMCEPSTKNVLLRKIEIDKYILDMVASAPYVKQERQHPVSVCLLCIRRTLIEENRLRFKSEREVASEDTLFKIELLKRCNVMVCEDFPFYYYHLNGGSLTHSFNFLIFTKLRVLYENMIRLLGDSDEVHLRVNRFLISDIRTHIVRLVNSKEKSKISVLKKILNDDIWKLLKDYNPHFFPLYQCLFFQLCLKRRYYTLFFYVKSTSFIRKILKR